MGWQFDAFRDRRWWAAFPIGAVGTGGHLLSTLPDAGMTRPIFVAILAVMVVLTTVGFGLLMPGEGRSTSNPLGRPRPREDAQSSAVAASPSASWIFSPRFSRSAMRNVCSASRRVGVCAERYRAPATRNTRLRSGSSW